MASSSLKRISRHLETAQSEIGKATKLLAELTQADEMPAGSMVDRFPKFKMFSRQDKGLVFTQALEQSGYTLVHDWRTADFILADHDQRSDMKRMQRENKKLFIHPHSARSMILWDGILPTSPFVRCNFVFAPGHAKVMRLYGYTRPVEVIGWTYCPIKPFTPSPVIEKVLFAPIHPNQGADARGQRLTQHDKGLNTQTFEALQKLPIKLTVRYFGKLEDNGIPCVDGVEYVESDLTLKSSLDTIQAHDIIVGHQTFAYLAIASGKPTVMFGEDTAPHAMHVQVRSWHRYRNLLMYPLDLLVGEPMGVLEQAARSDEPIQTWRKNFIGEPFDPNYFVTVLEKYLV